MAHIRTLKTIVTLKLIVILLLITACASQAPASIEEEPGKGYKTITEEPKPSEIKIVNLIADDERPATTLEDAFKQRQSTRIYDTRPLALSDLSRLLWAAQGTVADTVSTATRTAPSAGATHPIELFVVAGEVESVEPGLYHYQLSSQELVFLTPGDIRKELAQAALGQEMIARAPAVIILAADFQRTVQRYGPRGQIYVYMEIGGVAQNIALQAAALDIGNVAVGAFRDEEVVGLLQIGPVPLLIIPVGYRAE